MASMTMNKLDLVLIVISFELLGLLPRLWAG